MARLNPEDVRKIVVRGVNWVGDAVMTIPALRELRQLFPQAAITLATRSWAKGIFADAEFIDDLLINDRKGIRSIAAHVSDWKQRQFDLAILFPNAFEPALIASVARVPQRVGYASQGRGFLLTHRFELPDWRESRHEVFYYLNIIAEMEALLGKSSRKRVPDCSIRISPERQLEARSFLTSRQVRPDRPTVALCPGSINSRAKRWPAENFARLGDLLVAECNATILLIGSGNEMEISQKVSGLMDHKPVVLTGETDLSQLTAILNLIDLLVTNDTGPAHIATALERPTLVIFGPTNPSTTRPFGPMAQILRKPPECAPCMLRDCPIDHRCMTAVSVEDVFESACAVLSNRGLELSAEASVI